MLATTTAPALPPAPVPAQVQQLQQLISCEACGTRFPKSRACRIGNSDYCPSCDEERWNELIALQEELDYGSAAMLSDWHDHSFAGMF